MIAELIEMYSFSFMQNALAVGVFGGALLAFLGIFVHLRRIVFLGAALPQVVAFGIAAAVLFSLSPLLGAIAGGALGITLLSLPGKTSRIPPDGWIGLAYAAGSSIAVVFIALSPSPDAHVLRFFTGDVLGTSRVEVYYTLAVLAGVALLFFWFWSRFVMTGFDPTMAAALGINTNFWDALLFICLGFSLAVVMNSAGGMLAFSMLVGPSAAGLLISRNFKIIVAVAVTSGPLAAFVGLTFSFLYDIPGGPSMATAALATVPAAYLIRALKS